MMAKRGSAVMLSLVFLVGFVVVAGAANSADKSIPAGTAITTQNWQQYKDFMSVGLQSFFNGQSPFKFGSNFRMVVGPYHHYPVPSVYAANTEKYSGQIKIEALPDGGHVIRDYVAGLPFPNPQAPLRGWKVLVNLWYRFVPWEECEPAWYIYLVDRLGNEHITAGKLSYRRFAHISDPVKPISDPAGPGIDYSEFLGLILPEEAKYTSQLTLYYDNPLKPEDLFVFIPALRRSLRLSAASRCAPVAGSDLTQDDIHTGFNGGIIRWTVKFLGQGQVLALYETDPKVYGIRANYNKFLFPMPAIGQWEVRPVDVIDVRRVPSQQAGYCYGKRVMYIDTETWANLWSDLYDSAGKLWKVQMISHPPGKIPLIGYTSDAGNFIEPIWDLQNAHASTAVSAAPNGETVRNNQDCASYDGVNYTDAARFNTVQALSEIMR